MKEHSTPNVKAHVIASYV